MEVFSPFFVSFYNKHERNYYFPKLLFMEHIETCLINAGLLNQFSKHAAVNFANCLINLMMYFFPIMIKLIRFCPGDSFFNKVFFILFGYWTSWNYDKSRWTDDEAGEIIYLAINSAIFIPFFPYDRGHMENLFLFLLHFNLITIL